MPARKGKSRCQLGNDHARKRPRLNAEQADADVNAEQADAAINLAQVLDSTAAFDVAGFGVIQATTTYLCGNLIGKSVRLADSTWGTEYSASEKSTCVIDGFVWQLQIEATTPVQGLHSCWPVPQSVCVAPYTVWYNLCAERTRRLVTNIYGLYFFTNSGGGHGRGPRLAPRLHGAQGENRAAALTLTSD